MKISNIPSNIVNFLNEVRLEVKKVSWPTREETIRYTLIVIGVSVAVALYLGGVDFLITTLLHFYIIR